MTQKGYGMSLWARARTLLEADGLCLSDGMVERLEAHMALVGQWNGYASLVSQGDLADLAALHVVDALSLAPWIHRLCGHDGVLLDIGSGGGFPALPLKVVLPGLVLTLVERSAKKASVLRRMLVGLGMSDVTLLNAAFPEGVGSIHPRVLTARAVERPGEFWRTLEGYLQAGQVFFCQTGDISMVDTAKFHVEHVEDAWTRQGLRRGALDLIRRR